AMASAFSPAFRPFPSTSRRRSGAPTTPNSTRTASINQPHREGAPSSPSREKESIMSVAEPVARPAARKIRAKQPVQVRRPSREEALEAVRTLIRWAGDDPEREGLVGTPDRVVRSYAEFFSGYDEDPVALLQRTFEETDGYDEIVMLKDIRFESHCEHNIAPISGKVHIAYLPSNRVVGISKLARLVEVYAKRLQIQEKMTAQIANTLDE